MRYFAGLYDSEKHGISGARLKAGEHLGAFIFASPRDRAWKEAATDAIEKILDWYESDDEADRPTVQGRPCDAMLITLLREGLRQHPLAPKLPTFDLEAGKREFDHYMSGRAGRSVDWKTLSPSAVNLKESR
jgi:hypothetical protein